MIIGQLGVFIQQKHHSDPKKGVSNIEIEGVILDRFRGWEKDENGNILASDKYVVMLKNGVIAKPFCEELVRVEMNSHVKKLESE